MKIHERHNTHNDYLSSLSISTFLFFLFYLLAIHSDKTASLKDLFGIFSGLVLMILLFRVSLIDISTMNIPRLPCIVGIPLGLAYSIFDEILKRESDIKAVFINHVFATILAYIAMKFLSHISQIILGIEAIGVGDSHLVALGGSWLGLLGISLAICIAFLSAGIFSFLGWISGKLKPIEAFPFAPFISIGILGVWLFEPNWWATRWLSLWGL